MLLAELFPDFGVDVGLIEDAAQGADRNLRVPGNDRRIDNWAQSSDEFDVAASLTGLDKTRSFEPALYLI